MKNFRIYFFVIPFFIFSCNSESEEPKKEKETVAEDTVATETKDTVLTEEVPVGKLPRMTGSWIETNLDNEYFRSKRIDSLVASKPTGPTMPTDEAVAFFTYDFLSQKELQKLNSKELIYYCLAYPCSYSQVCAGGIGDTTTFPKIGGYLPFSYEGEQMSTLQLNEVRRRRDSVVLTLMNFIEFNPDKISLPYLELLVDLDAVEAFPVLIKTASENNLNNYSFLLEMMHKHEYEYLSELPFYSLLYGEESYRYENRAKATKENCKAVLKLARRFYEYYIQGGL